jgi:hypothetical protein
MANNILSFFFVWPLSSGQKENEKTLGVCKRAGWLALKKACIALRWV